jgi:hypothetical protein
MGDHMTDQAEIRRQRHIEFMREFRRHRTEERARHRAKWLAVAQETARKYPDPKFPPEPKKRRVREPAS